MNNPGPFELSKTFVHLEADQTARPIAVTETFWQELSSGKLAHLEEGRLLSSYSFSEDWNVWEMHPSGEELVCLLSGAVDFVLEQSGTHSVIELRSAGSFILVPRGVWHTAKARAPSSMMFITPGEGTDHRPVSNGDFSGK